MSLLLSNSNKKTIAKSIEVDGYFILRNAISTKFIDQQKKRWAQIFRKNIDSKYFVRGNLILGESNFLSYSKIPSWCMFRYFEFLWNKSTDENAKNIHIELHKFRNSIQSLPEEMGLNYNTGNYGIYISTSLYPPGKGMLEAHSDGHGELPILHYMLPFTFKGEDYDEGGLYIEDNHGNIIDIDSNIKKGDLIFFDGRNKHWVKKIKSSQLNQIGRLASFAIPTYFEKSYSYAVLIRSIKIFIYQVFSKMSQFFLRKKKYPN